MMLYLNNALDSSVCVLQGINGSLGIKPGVIGYDGENSSSLTAVLKTDPVLVVPVIAHGFEVVFVKLFVQP